MSGAKCTVREGKFVVPCDSLKSATEYGNPSGTKKKGIYAWAYRTLAFPTRTMFGVKSGEHVAKGLMFNYCPFCGEKIDAPFSVAAADSTTPADSQKGN